MTRCAALLATCGPMARDGMADGFKSKANARHYTGTDSEHRSGTVNRWWSCVSFGWPFSWMTSAWRSRKRSTSVTRLRDGRWS